MILKLSIFSLFILLIVVLTISYYTQLEGFDNAMPAATTTAPVSSLADGQAVRCTIDATGGKGANTAVYRYTKADGKLHFYPNPAIASSWDPNWQNFIQVPDCSSMTTGTDLEMNKGPLGLQGPEGPMGPRGPRGPIGPMGPAGQPVPATASDLSKGSSIVPPSGAGPASIMANGPAAPMAVANAASNPQRNDIQSHVALSDTGYNAMDLKQKSDLLSSIQKMFRNELLASRSTDSSTIDPASCASSVSSSIQQGNEYTEMSQKDPSNCSAGHDMSKYIKKDSIPCYGCALDY